MKLNTVERLLMNNPVRTAIQFRGGLLLKKGGWLDGKRVLEIRCGRG